VEYESDDHELDFAYPTVAYYRFATQNLISLEVDEDGIGIICDFDGHDPDRCEGRAERQSSHEQCADYLFFRETDEKDDDDDDHHHSRH
jgi:hypothetical protein